MMGMSSNGSERKNWKQNNFFKQQVWIGRKSNPKVRGQAMHLTSRRQTNNLAWKGFFCNQTKDLRTNKGNTMHDMQQKENIEKNTRIDNQPNHHDGNDF